jgi:polyhydroxyalkanoate synthase
MEPDAMSLRHRAVSGLTALSTAFERRRHPQHFILTDKTPWMEIYRNGIMSVRHYSLPPMQSITVEDQTIPVQEEKHRIPLLLVPALGIHSWTFDIMPNRSMVRYLMARGYQVYLIDWGSPSKSERNLTLSSYVNHWMPQAVAAVCEHSGSKQINLVGYCMGGLLCFMYLGSRRDAPVKAIATIASPVNFHKGGTLGRLGSFISLPALKANEWLRFRLDPLDSSLFHVPGKLVSFGFKLTNPPGVVTAYLDLVRHITDREYVTEHMTMGQWFNDMVDYPGATVREIISKMVIGNDMAEGKMSVGKCQVNFKDIRQDLLALAGKTDNICTLEAARDIMHLTCSKEKRFEVVPGGHAGVFAGSKAPANTWRIIADWMAVRSD